MTLRLVFMGSPAFAVPILQSLAEAGHAIVQVYAQPPKPAGRGRRSTPTPVHAWAETGKLPVRTPKTLKDPAEQEFLRGLNADACVAAAYGLILPPAVLRAPRLGCLNVHASLLPRWRGAAPIERAILAGDRETGVTIMQMDEGLDTGPTLLAESVPIGPTATASELHDGLAALGAKLIVRALAGVQAGTLRPRPQAQEGATYAKKIAPDEGRLDWTRPASELARQVRALNPRPGVWFERGGERIKVLAASAEAGGARRAQPGTLLDDRLGVAAGDGILRLLRLQRAGKAAVDAGPFLRGTPLPAGIRLD